MPDKQPDKSKSKHNPQLSDKPRCGAKTRGETAANGTGKCIKFPVKGQKRCKTHGGGSPQAKRAAVVRDVEQQIRKTLHGLEVVPVKDPLTALSELAGEVTNWKDNLAAHVGQLKTYGYSGEHGEQIRAEVQLYERALDRTVTILDKIARLDIDSRLAAIGERQADLVEAALAAALAALELTVDQEQKAWGAVGAHLRALPQAG
jgi:hypothetical protein